MENQDIQPRIESLVGILMNFNPSEYSKLQNEKLIETIIKNENTIILLFEALNKKRSSLIEIGDQSFVLIATIFNKILDKLRKSPSHTQEEFYQLEYLMILSQTIYKKPKCPENILAEQLWKPNLKLWNSSDIWRQLIMYQIFKEWDNSKKLNPSYEEGSPQFINVVFSVLVTYKVNMEAFHCNKQTMEILNEYAELYNLTLP